MSRSFHSRFGIDAPIEEAQRRFVNRALNLIFEGYIFEQTNSSDLRLAVVNALGDYDYHHKSMSAYIEGNFHRCLLALEGLYLNSRPYQQEVISTAINGLIAQAETDIGVHWENGSFYLAGVEFLDEPLVRDNLAWLRQSDLRTVLKPFEKGLRHLLDSQARPELLGDTITDMYEAFEAMTKVVTGSPKPAKDKFLEMLGAPSLVPIAKAYADFAHLFRHSEAPANPRPAVTEPEVEALVYLTGVFLRLASRLRPSVG